MARGGARPGAGRKKGVANKRSTAAAAKAILNGDSPLDVGLAAMRMLFAEGALKEAGDLAVKLAPFIHPRFSPEAERRLEPHTEQKKQLSLFDPVPPPAPVVGKKEAAAQAAISAAEGTGWGNLLETEKPN